MPSDSSLRTTIPLTVTVSDTAQGAEEIVEVRVTAATGASTTTEVKHVRVVMAPTSMLVYIVLGMWIVAGAAEVATQARRERSSKIDS